MKALRELDALGFALAVARWLAQDGRVEWVSYPGLESHPEYRNAARYLTGGFGGVLTFGVKGGHAAAKALIDRVKLFSLLANVGDRILGRSLCALGDFAVYPVRSYLQHWRPEFEAHLEEGGCPFGGESSLEHVLAPVVMHSHLPEGRLEVARG